MQGGFGQEAEVLPARVVEEKAVQWAAKEEDPEPDIVTALVNINHSMAALVRAVMESNDYLWTITEYVEWLVWGKESDESDEESVEWDSGDDQVVRESSRNVINTG